MSQFAQFMRENKKTKENEKYAPTASLVDENGKPLEWEFRHITSKENEKIRDNCTYDEPVKGKPNQTKPHVDTSKYIVQMVVASTVYPDLYDKELQDSYGVMSPEDLVFAMIDDPGEYNDFIVWLQTFEGFNKSLQEDVDEAKN